MSIPCLTLAAGALAGISGCADLGMTSLSSAANAAQQTQPAMRWDHREEANEWTKSTIAAIASHDVELASAVPADVNAWCPGYPSASLPDRRAFWSGLLSAVAKYESSWNPTVSGAGGRYIGLLQISSQTALNYHCDANSSTELKVGSANLECAVEIMAAQVGRDGKISGNGNRGIARDWGPMKSAGKRADMAAWTSAQTYCRQAP